MIPVNSKTIVFVTGAFVTHRGWDNWKLYFESRGYTTYAPPWPFKDASPQELRALHPDKNLGLSRLTLDELVDHYARFVTSLPERPIAIGHSLGGLITQILVNRDLVAAGVAIHSVPPQGVFPYEFSFLKAGWKVLGILTSLDDTYLMSFEDWQYAFVNEMPLEEQKAAYEANTIPESKVVARGGLSSAAHVDFEKEHPPLLLTSGSLDNIIPEHLNRRNFNHYQKNNSIMEYQEFEGRNHFVLGQATWREDADYILNWLKKLSAAPVAPAAV
ncbi:Esterase/lipase [Catalinimonas alkaloidigena]|uniref:Esterase/lipase n=1 Tax=Catalinimonas alkaloidigena TaxID=1075417 RepID=A0A1G9TIJ3_9BACT|nr:alpha/beta hydrolase [Catalinimonas alkaloidigena]SDM46935.1 Esterase/lipase [Catalinimonas alkaloidigena]